jgi:hypothetical protein
MDIGEKRGKVMRIEFRIPLTFVCPNCREKQKFKKHEKADKYDITIAVAGLT